VEHPVPIFPPRNSTPAAATDRIVVRHHAHAFALAGPRPRLPRVAQWRRGALSDLRV
jgi:hypothetical protein